MKTVGFDTYVEETGKPGSGVFILLLDDEHSYLSSQDSHWLNFVNENVTVVRLSVDEFKVLDYGVHPLVQFFLNGKEYKTFRGIISLGVFNKTLKDMNHECRRKSGSR